MEFENAKVFGLNNNMNFLRYVYILFPRKLEFSFVNKMPHNVIRS
jgi:hypothetical protein